MLSGGVLTMQNPADVLTVQGSAAFVGGSTNTRLTAGTIYVGGNFTQSWNASQASYAPSGTHLLVFNGTSQQTVQFETPGSGVGQSHFQHVEIAKPFGTLILNSNIIANGQLRSPESVTPIVLGGGRTLTVVGVDIDNLILDNVLLTINGGTIGNFDYVTFQNYAATATQLTITHPGTGGPFTFNNLSFLTTPTTGFSISATDTATGDGTILHVTVRCSTPADGSARTAQNNALVDWVSACADATRTATETRTPTETTTATATGTITNTATPTRTATVSGGEQSHHAVAMYFASVNSSRPSWPPSRPTPLFFTPPKGAEGSETRPRLRPTMPDFERCRDAQAARQIAGVDIRDQAVLGRVGAPDHVVDVVEGDQRRHRTEDLLGENR